MDSEPIFELPQRIDINDMRRSMLNHEETMTKKTGKGDTHEKQNTTIEDDEDPPYYILPLLHNDRVIGLSSFVSLEKNNYLACRWNYFLKRGDTAEYPRIRLYSELHKTKVVPRRMQLNGQFYGVTNKLSPVPVRPSAEEKRGRCTKFWR